VTSPDVTFACAASYAHEMKVLTGVVALVSVAVLGAGGGSSRHMSAPLRQRIAAVARTTARKLADPSVTTAQAYGPASYRAVLVASEGVTTTNRRRGRFYLIVLHGRFVCAGCPRPPGAQSPQGSIATRLWSPDGAGGGGFGIRSKLPATISQLGRPTLISLR
jgi:hypothetical protein